mmetsp:Transcript_2436/g.7265  ORF Transcript_2436/g.7265 Transcript_2436/m.7265 type:complete len:209 (-) Transcript_2436:97-723(-)
MAHGGRRRQDEGHGERQRRGVPRVGPCDERPLVLETRPTVESRRARKIRFDAFRVHAKARRDRSLQMRHPEVRRGAAGSESRLVSQREQGRSANPTPRVPQRANDRNDERDHVAPLRRRPHRRLNRVLQRTRRGHRQRSSTHLPPRRPRPGPLRLELRPLPARRPQNGRPPRPELHSPPRRRRRSPPRHHLGRTGRSTRMPTQTPTQQ